MPSKPTSTRQRSPTGRSSEGRKRPRTARGEATRQRLLAAAESLFGSKGFHGTAVRDITMESGVAQGTFYLYFDSKEEIFRELIRDLSHRLRAAIAAATEGLEGRLEIELAGIREFLRFAAAHRDLYRIVFESEFIDPEIFRWYYERIADGYARGLEAAMEAGQVRRLDPETAAYCLMGAAHFLGMRWVVWEGVEPPPEVLRSLSEFLRAALDGEPGALPRAGDSLPQTQYGAAGAPGAPAPAAPPPEEGR